MTMPEILEYIEGLETESRAVTKDLLKMCWYMRGGVTLDEIFASDITQRRLINEIIGENLETTKQSRLPFF